MLSASLSGQNITDLSVIEDKSADRVDLLNIGTTPAIQDSVFFDIRSVFVIIIAVFNWRGKIHLSLAELSIIFVCRNLYGQTASVN